MCIVFEKDKPFPSHTNFHSPNLRPVHRPQYSGMKRPSSQMSNGAGCGGGEEEVAKRTTVGLLEISDQAAGGMSEGSVAVKGECEDDVSNPCTSEGSLAVKTEPEAGPPNRSISEESRSHGCMSSDDSSLDDSVSEETPSEEDVTMSEGSLSDIDPLEDIDSLEDIPPYSVVSEGSLANHGMYETPLSDHRSSGVSPANEVLSAVSHEKESEINAFCSNLAHRAYPVIRSILAKAPANTARDDMYDAVVEALSVAVEETLPMADGDASSLGLGELPNTSPGDIVMDDAGDVADSTNSTDSALVEGSG